MFLFGENNVGGGPAYLVDTLYGHFDSTYLAGWGLPVNDCVVRRVFIYCQGSPALETATLQFGVYDATDPVYSNWTLFAVTPTLTIGNGLPPQWWTVHCNIIVPAGNYALSVLDVNGPVMTWSAGVHFFVKPNGMAQKTFVGGVFPDPLGVCTTATFSWSMYADDGVDTPYTPTHACLNQPGCSVGD